MQHICPQCEVRPLAPRKDRRPNRRPLESRCRECLNANLALSRYWKQRGMPLSWGDSPRNWLQSRYVS
jgi:hypothetical protein